jgi:hypothetical protein
VRPHAAQFTGEESDGRFVDMENLYNQFFNLKKVISPENRSGRA